MVHCITYMMLPLFPHTKLQNKGEAYEKQKYAGAAFLAKNQAHTVGRRLRHGALLLQAALDIPGRLRDWLSGGNALVLSERRLF